MMQPSGRGRAHEEHRLTGFTPRPEAQAYPWERLLTPIRKATGELILWLEGAYHSYATLEEEEQLATSLLVSGERGAGKTTVLLSAASAFRRWEDFIPAESSSPTGPAEEKMASEVRSALKSLHKHVIWLDLLDVEPLPRDVNLLATLLVRVRSALDQAYGSSAHEGWAAPSLLEERGANPWGQLDQLIRDAAFLWERTTERDHRLRSEQQIKSAELYVNFRRRFRDAMESVARALSQREFGREGDQELILVMPIDNVDRSVEHIRHIMNLTRMVASRRLWFVLAAERAEFQLFLQRVFQDELAASGRASLGPDLMDETLAITRRQAAAALRKKAPPIQRIMIGSVLPDEAWRFCPPGGSSELSRLSLGALLGRIRLALPMGPLEDEKRKGHQCTLADLFDIHRRLSMQVRTALWRLWPKSSPLKPAADAAQQRAAMERLAELPIFSNAGRLTLTLPARPLQDLWQAALKEAEDDPEGTDDEAAIRVVTSMLRNGIAESDLPHWASELLRRRVIQRDTLGATVLNLTGSPVSRQSMGIERERLETFPAEPPGSGDGPRTPDPGVRLKTEVWLREFTEIRLRLHTPEKPEQEVELPPNVTGSLIMLHDLLTMTTKPRLLNASETPLQTNLGLAFTSHEAVLRPPELAELRLAWPTPVWDTFAEFSIFTVQWLALLLQLESVLAERAHRRHDPQFVRSCAELFHAAWIDNVCSIAREEHGNLSLQEAFEQLTWAAQDPRECIESGGLRAYQRKVCGRLADLFETAQSWPGTGGLAAGPRNAWRSRLEATRRWMEEALPQFLLPEFAPDPSLLVDVASDELSVETWVLVPLYRYVQREAARVGVTPPARNAPPFRLTAHVGEDFRHLMEGLRHVFECMQYLLDRMGGRLGHATALGVEPRVWAESVGSVMMPAEARLWDLVFEWRLYSSYRIPPELRAAAPPGRPEQVENAIRELSGRIFHRTCAPQELAEAHHVLHQLFTPPVARVPPDGTPDGFLRGLHNADWERVRFQGTVRRVLDAYRTDEDAFIRGQTLVDVALDGSEVAALYALQDALRRAVGARGIVVEVNPSSNLLIGDLMDLRSHPILRLFPPEPEPGAPPPVPIAVGSDDPVTFSTYLLREYALLYEAAHTAGYAERAVHEWLATIRQTSMDARFTAAWFPSARDLACRLMDALDDFLQRPRRMDVPGSAAEGEGTTPLYKFSW